MEVQKYKSAPGRTFASYIWELIIVFIAVFAALYFFNKLNKQPQSSREKELVQAVIADLGTDISAIDRYIRFRNDHSNQLDSLMLLISGNKIYGYENDLYYFGKNATRDITFRNSSRFNRELDNSKRVNIIQNSVALDSILSYEKAFERMGFDQAKESDDRKAMNPLIAKIYSPQEFEKMLSDDGQVSKPKNNPFLRSTEPEDLTNFAFYLHEYKASVRANTNRLRRLQVRAKRLIDFLQQQYQLK